MNRAFGAAKPTARQGMALVSVLLVMVVLLGLAGAFFTAHRSDLALMTTAAYREQSKNACLSVADFLQYKLQNDRKFGMAAFPVTPSSEAFPASGTPMLTATYYSTSSRTRGRFGTSTVRNFIEGTIPESGTEFEVEILNNLDGVLSRSVATSRMAPPRTCRAWITSRSGNVTQNIDFILKRSPFTNASITSGKDINVQLTDSSDGAWWLGARQPSGNNVRASGSINGPEVWSPAGRAVLFTPPPGMETLAEPPYGVLSGDTLTMQVDGVPTELVAGDDKLKESEDNIKGVLSPGSGSVKIPELNRDDLQGPARKVVLPNAKLVFRTELGASGEVVHILEGDDVELARYNSLTSEPKDRYFSWDDSMAEDVSIDLETRFMAVAENVELQTHRDFSLRSVTPTGANDSSRQPTLYLGSVNRGAALDARNVEIEGSVGGMGAVKAQNDLQIAAKSNLSTTPDFGIALHAGRDIVLTKPGVNSRDGLAVDWDAFASAYESGESNSVLDDWADRDQAQRQVEAAKFKGRQLAPPGKPEAFEEIWANLTTDLPADDVALEARDEWLKEGVPAVMGEDPEWEMPPEPPEGWPGGEPPTPPVIELQPGVPAGPGIDVDKYVRLREYLRTVKAGQPDPSWLGSEDPVLSAQRRNDVTNLVSNQLSSYQLQAGQVSRQIGGQVVLKWKTLGEFFDGSNPYLASYAPDMLFRGLIYAGRDFIFDTERKGVYIEGALVAKGNITISNATGARFVYNSELLENLFATEEEDTSVPLERAYWAFY